MSTPSERSDRRIPRGVEVLVSKAAVDPAFRALLLNRRAEAAEEIELELTPAEAALLNAVPQEQLEAIIDQTTVPPEHRRAFLGKAAAAMLAAVGLMSAGCPNPTPETGSRPDDPTRDDGPDPEPPGSEAQE